MRSKRNIRSSKRRRGTSGRVLDNKRRTSHKRRYKSASFVAAAGERTRDLSNVTVVDSNPPAGSYVFNKIWDLLTDTDRFQFITEDDKYFVIDNGSKKEIKNVAQLFMNHLSLVTQTELVFPGEKKRPGPLRHELVARFSTHKLIHHINCPICYGPLTGFVEQCKQCKYCFHTGCARPWSQYFESCPMCRDVTQWKDRRLLTVVSAPAEGREQSEGAS